MKPPSLLQIRVPPLDEAAQTAARKRWDRLTKPQGSLGRLEEIGTRIAGMIGWPVSGLDRKVVFTVAADHGVAAEGVSAYPQKVTAQMVVNFLQGGAGINVLARYAQAEVVFVDAGVAFPIPFRERLISCGVRQGTGNMRREPAMTRDQAHQIVLRGMEIFGRIHYDRPVGLVGLGEMGIGNTTASSALTAVLTGSTVREVTGRGTGLTEEAWVHKVRVIEDALKLHQPDSADPVDCLAKIGGLEIGCLAGIALAAAQARRPVVLDGFIASCAGLVAARIAPGVEDYFIASHRSAEPGHRKIVESLKLEPLLDLQMRLGEGTGAALGFFLVEAAIRLLNEMATFDGAGVSEA